MTPLQKGFFIAETAEYAEHYLKKISALSAFSAMSFCSGLIIKIRAHPRPSAFIRVLLPMKSLVPVLGYSEGGVYG